MTSARLAHMEALVESAVENAAHLDTNLVEAFDNVVREACAEIRRAWAENATLADALVQLRTLCRKHGHATAEDASAIARDMELAGKGRFRIYSCEKCGRYHVAHAVSKRIRRRRGH